MPNICAFLARKSLGSGKMTKFSSEGQTSKSIFLLFPPIKGDTFRVNGAEKSQSFKIILELLAGDRKESGMINFVLPCSSCITSKVLSYAKFSTSRVTKIYL